MITLYDYYRSSASYRVRIVLNLKQLPHQLKEIHLAKNGGEQHTSWYKALNPNASVPTMIDGDLTISQSLAIISYLDEKYPQKKVLPEDIALRAKVRAFAQIIACDIHPVDNLRILKYLQSKLDVNDTQKLEWYQHWIVRGFTALEKILHDSAETYCFGNEVTLADACLIPQVYNANRFKVDMHIFPNIQRVNTNAMQLEAFKKADPDQQEHS